MFRLELLIVDQLKLGIVSISSQVEKYTFNEKEASNVFLDSDQMSGREMNLDFLTQLFIGVGRWRRSDEDPTRKLNKKSRPHWIKVNFKMIGKLGKSLKQAHFFSHELNLA